MEDRLYGMARGDDGSIFAGGNTEASWFDDTAGSEDFVAVKLDDVGDFQWGWQVRMSPIRTDPFGCLSRAVSTRWCVVVIRLTDPIPEKPLLDPKLFWIDGLVGCRSLSLTQIAAVGERQCLSRSETSNDSPTRKLVLAWELHAM